MLNISADFNVFALNVGPSVFKSMVRACGGAIEAANLAEVSVPTFYRWMSYPVSEEGWAGYPRSLVQLDKFAEKLSEGRHLSFFSLTYENQEILKTWREGRLSLVRDFGLTEADAMSQLAKVGVPRTTARRWILTVPYPRSLSRIDALALHRHSKCWFEKMAEMQNKKSVWTRSVPSEALSCLARNKVFPCLVNGNTLK